MPSPDSTPDEPPYLKSTLFCPECNHASPADGDWLVRARGDRLEYECPVCHTTITSRPRWSTAGSATRCHPADD